MDWSFHSPLEVVARLQDRLSDIVLSHGRECNTRFFQMFQQIRLYASGLQNFARTGSWLWFTFVNDSGVEQKALGCLRLVLQWLHTVVVVMQFSNCEPDPSTTSGFKARRVDLVDSFRCIVNEKENATFRLASVHHDCVRSKSSRPDGRPLCGVRPDGVFRHQLHNFYFLNPTWHSVNRL